MDDRVILYNPRRRPVELHADGEVVVVAAGERVERVRSRQIDRLIAGGALQHVGASPPDAPSLALDTTPPAEQPDPPEAPEKPESPRRRPDLPRRPV
ncbi:hypothetical protein ASE88_10640 [Sphingomonas sp. Leaf38]|nr:hypothetical protein ASE88_10640 [Sphingomonas sp. Leaf38]